MQNMQRVDIPPHSATQSKHKNGGLLRWWLRLTAPSGAQDYSDAPTRLQRDRLRRAGLTSLVALFLLAAPLLLLQQALTDLATAAGIVVMMFITVTALVLNRFGKQALAALLLVLSLDIIIEGTLVSAKGGLGSGWLLTFDLFIIPLITVGILLSRKYLWLFMLLHIAFIIGDFYLLPHAPDLDALVLLWHGPAIAFARPVIIQFGGCLLSFIEVQSTDQAITRADRAEEVVALRQSIVEEKQQLEVGIREIIQIIVKAANGHFTVRASLPQENILWQIATSLNTLFARLQSYKQVEVTLNQTEQEARRLAEALHMARTGQHAIWPMPSGGPLDPLIREIRASLETNVPSSSSKMPFPNRTTKSGDYPPPSGSSGF